jgi:hypothetical protein
MIPVSGPRLQSGPAAYKAAVVPSIRNLSLGSMSSNAIINGTITLKQAGAEEELDDYLLISTQKKNDCLHGKHWPAFTVCGQTVNVMGSSGASHHHHE